MQNIKDSLQSICSKYNGTISSFEGKYNTGRSIQPEEEHKCDFDLEGMKVVLLYDFMGSEFSKAGVMNPGAVTNEHHCSLTCTYEDSGLLANFSIAGKSRLAEFFSSGIYKIKCKDQTVIDWIKKNTSIKSIFKKSRESRDFDPIIKGKLVKDKFIITVLYMTSMPAFEILEEILEWFKQINKFPNAGARNEIQ